MVEDYIKCLIPVNYALSKMQAEICLVADGLDHWKDLIAAFEEMGPEATEWQEKVAARYKKCVSGLWFVGNTIHPKFHGKRLTESEWKAAIIWILR